MSSIFPLRDTVRQEEPGEPRLVDLDEETADEVFETLAASTTREIFLSLHEQPQTASDLAEVTDTSVQNVQYHLGKLQDAGLVSVVDTWYSERGSEMEVFAPDDESLVLYAGRDKQSTFRSILNRMLGFVSFILPTSILAGWVASRTVSENPSAEPASATDDGTDGQDAAETTASGDEPTDIGTEDSDAFARVESDAPMTEETSDIDVEAVDMPEGGVEELQPQSGEIGTRTVDSDLFFSGNETDGAEVIISQNQTETPLLITDGGNATVLTEDALNATLAGESPDLATQAANTTAGTADQAASTTASVDPAVLVGLAFLCGAIVVFVALWAWYGTPE